MERDASLHLLQNSTRVVRLAVVFPTSSWSARGASVHCVEPPVTEGISPQYQSSASVHTPVPVPNFSPRLQSQTPVLNTP